MAGSVTYTIRDCQGEEFTADTLSEIRDELDSLLSGMLDYPSVVEGSNGSRYDVEVRIMFKKRK